MTPLIWSARLPASKRVCALGSALIWSTLAATKVVIEASVWLALVTAVRLASLDLRISSACAFRPPALITAKASALTLAKAVLTSTGTAAALPTRMAAACTRLLTTAALMVLSLPSAAPVLSVLANDAATSPYTVGLLASALAPARPVISSVDFCSSCCTASVCLNSAALFSTPLVLSAGSTDCRSMPAGRPSAALSWTWVRPSASSVVRGVMTLEPAGALSTPVKGTPVSTLTPPRAVSAALHPAGKL